MREIKFRAWDEKWKRWIAPSDILVYGDGTQYFDRRAELDGDVIETATEGQCVLMQYTGQKDKNGREITRETFCLGGRAMARRVTAGKTGVK